MANSPQKGMVVLVGAGPGHPGLITLEGLRWLARADVVFHDRLACPQLLEYAPVKARRVFVGKARGDSSLSQDDINRLLIEAALEGQMVVRLKGGDPFIFGRGGEEAAALEAAGVPFRVVPGVTAASGAAAWMGLPLTDRRLAGNVAFVTAEEDPSRIESRLNWQALAGIDTVVFYMGVKTLSQVAARLIAAGKPADTPAAIIERATLPGQRMLTATLETIAQAAAAANIQPPAITIVGPVVKLAERLNWRAALPLAGRTIVVTRPADQSTSLNEHLSDLGADVLVAPAVEIHPLEDLSAIDTALRNLDQYAWVCFTSGNGVSSFLDRAAAIGLDGRALAGAKIAAIGPATAEALRGRFLRPDVVPQTFTGEALAGAILACDAALAGRRVLLARADIAQPELPAALRKAGATVDDVTVYRTARPKALPPEVLAALADRRVDWLTFTSGSTVRNFVELAAEAKTSLEGVKLASIGPSTSAALRAAGLVPTIQADPHTAQGLLGAILAAEGARE